MDSVTTTGNSDNNVLGEKNLFLFYKLLPLIVQSEPPVLRYFLKAFIYYINFQAFIKHRKENHIEQKKMYIF